MALTILPTPGRERRIWASRCGRDSPSAGRSASCPSSASICCSVCRRWSATSRSWGTNVARRVATASVTPGATVKVGCRSGVEEALRRQPTDAVGLQSRGDAAFPQLRPPLRVRRVGQQGPQPRLVRGRADRQPRRMDPIELLPQAIGQSPLIVDEILRAPASAPGAECTSGWSGRTRRNARGSRAQAIGERVGIAAVILRTGGRKAIPKAIQLLRVDGKDRTPELDQRVHQGAARGFDADGEGRRRDPGLSLQSLHGLVHRRHGMRDRQGRADLALGRRSDTPHARRCPNQSRHTSSTSPPRLLLSLRRPTVILISLVLALAAQLPTGCKSLPTSARRKSQRGAHGTGRRRHSRRGGRTHEYTGCGSCRSRGRTTRAHRSLENAHPAFSTAPTSQQPRVEWYKDAEP